MVQPLHWCCGEAWGGVVLFQLGPYNLSILGNPTYELKSFSFQESTTIYNVPIQSFLAKISASEVASSLEGYLLYIIILWGRMMGFDGMTPNGIHDLYTLLA